ncbi:MAG: GerMN domain-containing protein [Cellulosilyticaceae bacterium]
MRTQIKRVTLAIILLVISVSVGVATKNKKIIIIEDETITPLPQKSTKSIESYYPIAKDSLWNYTTKDGELVVSVDFIKDNVMQLRYQTEEETLVRVYVEEADILYEVATIEDGFVKNDYTLLRQYKDPVLMLPLEKGESWNLHDGAVRTITAIDEEVFTPGGTVKAIEVRTLHKDYELIQYYAEKIGIVKAQYEKNNKKQVMKLESFEMNTPLKIQVPAYYPNTRTERLSTVYQTIAVMTNEEPRHFLTDILSIEPKENMLQPLPNDAEINMIYLDKEKQKVQVDLSMEYADSGYTRAEQALAIQSIADTIGTYYKVEEIMVTVNGQLYVDGIKVRRE